MREILFRGKSLTGGWMYGAIVKLLDWKGDQCTYIIPRDTNGTNIIRDSEEVDPSTVGQYTGLTDKNGVKIFEGDFLATRTGENNYAYLVVYGLAECSGYGFGVEDVILDGTSYADYSGELAPLNKFIEEHVPMMVIGNVHDSPRVESCRWRNRG